MTDPEEMGRQAALGVIRDLAHVRHVDPADVMNQGWFHTQAVALEARAWLTVVSLQGRRPCDLKLASAPPAVRPNGRVEAPQLYLVSYQGEGWLAQTWTTWPEGTSLEDAAAGRVPVVQVEEMEGPVAFLVRLGDLGHRLDHIRHGEGFCPADEPPRDVDAVPALERLVGWAWAIIANAGGGDWGTQTEEWRDAARAWADDAHGAPLAPGGAGHGPVVPLEGPDELAQLRTRLAGLERELAQARAELEEDREEARQAGMDADLADPGDGPDEPVTQR